MYTIYGCIYVLITDILIWKTEFVLAAVFWKNMYLLAVNMITTRINSPSCTKLNVMCIYLFYGLVLVD